MMESRDLLLSGDWPRAALELLQRSNLFVCSEEPDAVQWFATSLCAEVQGAGGSETATLYGRGIRDLDGFCYQLCRALPWGFEMGRNCNAVIDVLRNYHREPEGRVVFWHDAHVLMEADPVLFADLVDSMNLVSAEFEAATPNLTTLLRNVFLFSGGESSKPDAGRFSVWRYPQTGPEFMEAPNTLFVNILKPST